MTTYCSDEDAGTLFGNIPAPSNIGQFVTAAAEEMDSYLGLRYVTPIILDETNPQQRPAALLLKRINSWLAAGRAILALDAGGEDDQLHQYGRKLIEDCMMALNEIKDGSFLIPGAEPVNPEENKVTGPVASFADDTSMVEAYGDTFGSQAHQALDRKRLPYFGNPRNLWHF